MRHYRSLTSVLTVLLLVGIGAGCENVPQIAGPADQAPQFARVGGPSTTSAPVAWTGDFTGYAISGIMPAGGGALEITDGADGPAIVRLIVPGGAAPGLPVMFTMKLDCTGGKTCVVDLTANSVTGRSITRFHRGVKLQINTVYLVPGGDNLRIAQAHDDGSFTSSPSSVDDDGFLTATLQHFSAYVPITD
ncbi:hypothetical protein BH23GEM10_BH23GEM10_08030 [soil metagenome]